ncbi:MAG: proton-conducting transporter membrane subunit [Verrucomicrobiota bacterium]
MTLSWIIVWAMVVCVAGAVLTAVLARARQLAGWVAFIVACAASSMILYAATQSLWHGPSHPVEIWVWKSMGFALRIAVDGLSAVFLILIGLVVPPALLYSIPYLEHYREHSVARYYPSLLLFVAGMIGLVTTTDAMFFFFVFWQVMTIPSFLLIRFEHHKPEHRRAAWKYMFMMQLACAITMIGALLIQVKGLPPGQAMLKYDFDVIREHLPALLQSNPATVAAAFLLFLIGFGIKAGMWPFGQMWLPDAHPAAPSPVSALLSGVMIKTGIYGLIRTFLWLTPQDALGACPLHVWGTAIATLGVITLVTGTVQALTQTQSKRLLAYSSIGQIGYILLGLGISLTLINSPLAGLAAVGLYGALMHTLNHGLFKSLLFLNAGSMLHATGTQDIGKIGGLMRYMPFTGVVTLIGSFCIAGVPLSNGFASKWNLYVSSLQAGSQAWFLPFFAVAAIMTSAVTLAVFIRFFGASFLSRTSQLVAERAAQTTSLEVPWTMRLPKLYLATLCIFLGLAPAAGFHLVQAALNSSRAGLGSILADAMPIIADYGTITGTNHAALLTPLATLAVLASMFLLVRFLSKLGGAVRRVSKPWLCGYALESEHNRYHAHNFYRELTRFLPWLGGRPAKPVPVSETAPLPNETPKGH